jgi:alpha-methylacyl-CoA racemase
LGPLHGVKVVEFAALGPGPFAAMMLADMGAEVLRVDRASAVAGAGAASYADPLNRNRLSAAIDLKNPDGLSLALKLVERADALIEGLRPGVMERLGLGPEVCLQRNPRLVYGRMTGWGQQGKLAGAPGHDIDYIALAGALHYFGRADQPPVPPLNLVGDFGGGGMLLAFGIVCALWEAARSGKGQVVDAAMVDGTALLMTLFCGLQAVGLQSDERGGNMLDGGAHFYQCYRTRDDRYVVVGALEPQFYRKLIELSGLSGKELPDQMDRSSWPAMKQRLAEVFRQKTRQQWCEIMEGSDACFAPVLTMHEAAEHPHMRERETYTVFEGLLQPAPAPRFSRTPGELRRPPPDPGQHTDQALEQWGISRDEIARLRGAGAVA